MRRVYALVLACTLVAAPLIADVLELSVSSEITAARLAAGDLDGDGVDELIQGGRVGPFLPVTEPMASRRAAIEVSALVQLGNGVALPRSLASYHGIEVVEDVGAGDLDGDGRDEIVAVGGGMLRVLVLREGRLDIVTEHELSPGRLWRVDLADIDGDGRDEIAVAATDISLDDGDASASVVTLYDADSHLIERTSLPVDAHIGDLCFGDFAGADRPQLALELGREESGGIVRLYDVGGGKPSEQLTQQLTQDGQRILGLAAQPGGGRDLLAAVTVRGQVLVARQSGFRMVVAAQQTMPETALPLRSLVAIVSPGRVGAAELMSAGGHGSGLWRITGLGF